MHQHWSRGTTRNDWYLRPNQLNLDMQKPVRKAVFPVAGLGTRTLPATKAIPKEMLPVVDKPLIQYAIEEAAAAGIEQFILVTGRNKTALEDHFDHAFELEHTLEQRGKDAALSDLVRSLHEEGRIVYTRQQRPLGLGHAVWCARDIVGDEPFAVLLTDELLLSDPPCLKQLIDAHQETGGSVVATMDVPREQVSRYGIADSGGEVGDLVPVRGLVEKPEPSAAPSTSALIGRYVLLPEVFQELSQRRRGAGGEIQLTDAMANLIGRHPFHSQLFTGQRFDCGDKLGYLEAILVFASLRPDLRDGWLKIIRRHAANS